jgi:hypothetical protein
MDGRAPLLVKHGLSEMSAQRIFGLALGYEDLNSSSHASKACLRGQSLLSIANHAVVPSERCNVSSAKPPSCPQLPQTAPVLHWILRLVQCPAGA